MPASPDRIAFITQPYRLAVIGPDATVEAVYGDMARETKNGEPIESLFDDIADAGAMAQERLTLMKAERGRYQVGLTGAADFALGLDFSQAAPTGTAIDQERGTNRPALAAQVSVDLRRGAASLLMWG